MRYGVMKALKAKARLAHQRSWLRRWLKSSGLRPGSRRNICQAKLYASWLYAGNGGNNLETSQPVGE